MELFNEGGLKDEGGSVDPVSGNDVPIGSTKKEVRDDIPAMLSEGEFVFPADVTRFIGLEKLMQQRQEAKMGLKQMEAMGQMGNSEEATMPDDLPFGPADLVILGRPEEAEPREMYSGGMVYANQGTFATGISDTQPSVYQGQTLPAAPAIPPSFVAPPTPTPAPAGGFLPTFIGQPTSTTPSPTIPTAPTTDEPFVPTVGDANKNVEYINPETGERRFFMHYQGEPVDPNSIPDGFILVEDYDEAEDAATDDLENTSVETTMVRDDNSADKKRLEDMVKNQGKTELTKLKENKDPEAIKAAYLNNEKAKALMTSLGLFNPIAALAGRGATALYGKQLEKLMTDLDIEKPEIESGFFENLKGAFSNMFTDTGKKSDKYEGTFSPSSNRLTRFTDKDINFLTEQDRRLYDAAVRRGDVNITNHFEGKNRRLNKMAAFMKDNMSDAEGRALGLSVYDIAQAKEQFQKGTGAILGDSVNEARENKEAAAKEAARKAARDRRKKRKATQKQNEDFTARKIKEYQETGRVTGFKEGGLASRKK